MTIHDTPKRSATMPKREAEEGLGHRQLHLSPIAERREQPFGLGLVVCGERQRETLKVRISRAPSVGGEHRRTGDLEARVHHLVLGTR